MTARRFHFVGGGSFGSMAACGRTVLAWRSDAPLWSADLSTVTCQACLRVMAVAC